MPTSSSSVTLSHPTQSFAQLLEEARRGEAVALGELLQVYCNYLSILASTQLNRRLRKRVNPSDLVQEALLAAHRDFGDFRGTSERELLAWLRQILIHCLHRAIEVHLKAGKRDLRREISMEDASRSLDRSAVKLASRFTDQGPSPSAPLHERERSVALANQLAKLKPSYRDVIVYRNLQGLCFEEIAERMGRNPGAVRMLWLRAMEKFREQCERIE